VSRPNLPLGVEVMLRARRLLYVAVLVACGVAWGSTQSLGKLAVSTGHGAWGLIFWQFVIGSAVMGAATLLRGRRLVVTRRSLVFAVVVALTGTLLPSTTFYLAVAHLPAGIMSLLISTVPILAFPIALLLGQDRVTAGRIAGLLCGAAGVALIVGPDAALPGPGMVGWIPIALIGPLLYAVESNFVARYGTARMDPVQAMALTSLLGVGLTLPLALGSGQWIDPTAQWGAAETAFAVGAVVNVSAYAGYVWLAARTGAVFASQMSYVVTGSGLLWAAAILGERPSPWVGLALLVMLAGLFLVAPREEARRPGGR
jgi:drug/metabolite transporter (DMT)-like permease